MRRRFGAQDGKFVREGPFRKDGQGRTERAGKMDLLVFDEPGVILLGACAFDVPTVPRDGMCFVVSGENYLHRIPVEENMTATSFRLTWDPDSPLTERLAFTVSATECDQLSCDYAVPYWESGTSPLEWSAENLTEVVSPGWTLVVYAHFESLLDEPIGLTAGGLAKPFRISGEIGIAE